MSEADAVGLLYKLLKQRDENKKFKKTVDPNQILLEDCIKQKLKEQKKNV